jgi:hypothetical protein
MILLNIILVLWIDSCYIFLTIGQTSKIQLKYGHYFILLKLSYPLDITFSHLLLRASDEDPRLHKLTREAAE